MENPTTLQFFPVLVFGFMAALGLTPLSRQIAFRLGVVAIPSQRNIHQDHKPLMGGLAIVLAFALALLLFSPQRYLGELGAVLAGCALLAFIGLVDDRFDLSPWLRLGVMITAALLPVAAGIQAHFTGSALVDIALTVFWIVTLTNALNFLDNMDGLSAGMASISAAAFLLIALSQGLILVSMLAAALLGSAVGFLMHNFNPASSFMGDMGAYVLGYVVAILALKVDYWAQPFSPYWAIPILALALPVVDMNLAIFTRITETGSLFTSGKHHVSHRLLALGWSQRQTLLVLYSAAILFGMQAVVLTALTLNSAWAIVVVNGLVMAGLALGLVVLRRNQQQKAGEQ
ncbi:MAG: undecaprenyl/decaprenyl-phosphate alpha-N-acetylglucosaminyl 1-phosphate transferase [Armatimonadetes bacterium]|nr:undecaprenyl/decaprenyl-phosphate alpha-N-acetylglucosaminyl 1-phosphate transferase [Anaerolineae bacterium]